MMILAFFPIEMLPYSLEAFMANAPLMVAALIASSGLIFILIHARLTIKFMFPLGADPGLKSVASAKGRPESISGLAGV